MLWELVLRTALWSIQISQCHCIIISVCFPFVITEAVGIGTKNTLWDLYWTVFVCNKDNLMHTQGNKRAEDERKISSKLFKCFKVITGNTVKLPEENSISHLPHENTNSQLFVTVCQVWLKLYFLAFWKFKMHKYIWDVSRYHHRPLPQSCMLATRAHVHIHTYVSSALHILVFVPKGRLWS